MEKLFGVIVILLIVLIFFIFILMGLIVFYLMKKDKESKQDKGEVVPEVPQRATMFCQNHPGIKSSGICAICEEPFCEDCLKEADKLHFCPDHYEVYNNNSWSPIVTVKTTPNRPEDGIFIYNFKEKIWKEESIPTFIVTNYKINVESDFIESYVSYFVKDEDAGQLKQRLDCSSDIKKGQ
jgi:hypothetical protein